MSVPSAYGLTSLDRQTTMGNLCRMQLRCLQYVMCHGLVTTLLVAKPLARSNRAILMVMDLGYFIMWNSGLIVIA